MFNSNVTLDGNIFIENKAAFAGAILAKESILLLRDTLGNNFAHDSANREGGQFRVYTVVFI